MAYVALYRAYRPQKFSEVVGQEHIIKTLQNAIELNKVAHAYLFCGPRGTGKTTLAKIMAKALNCEHGISKEPCCQCDICQGITKGTISDVIEIDAASNNGADDIRALRDTVKFLPAVGKYKVYIIDEVHMLSTAAFNALLKTLEEPPKHVIFILATTDPYKIPNTILSRCQRFDFESISLDNIIERLKIVAKEENVNIDDEALYQIATSAEGGMRDALSIFDQCISFSTNNSISLDDVLQVSGNVSYLKIIELLNNCLSTNETDAIVVLNNIIKEGKEVPRIINDIILFLRDTLLYKNNAIITDKMMYKNDKFKQLANAVTKPIIYNWLDILNNALTQMRFSIQKRAFLELAILKMNDVKENENANLVERVNYLENAINNMINNGYQQPRQVQPQVIYSKPEPVYIPPVVEEKQPQEPINTSSDISQIINKKIEDVPVVAVDTADELTVEDVQNILYTANKSKKEQLLSVWNQIADKYQNIFAIQMLVRGNIAAVSDDAFIAVLQDVGFCNRVMQYENYVRIIEIFNEYNCNIKDYICVPKPVWSKIIADYKSKFNQDDNPKPKLEDIRIGVKKRIIPTINEIKVETEVDKLQDLFGDELKIVEE